MRGDYMYQDYQYYIQQLLETMQRQEQRIQRLEETVAQLGNELEELKSKPSINVEKIEYKFDQLKVETLEGTLNIGLNPSDLQGIDNMEINPSGANTKTPAGMPPTGSGSGSGIGHGLDHVDPKGMFRNTLEMEEEMFARLETELPQLIANAEARVNKKLEENYFDFIKEDIKMQIPGRVQHHLQHNPFRGSAIEKEGWKQAIVQKLLKEMENGICTFMTNLPNNLKGVKDE